MRQPSIQRRIELRDQAMRFHKNGKRLIRTNSRRGASKFLVWYYKSDAANDRSAGIKPVRYN